MMLATPDLIRETAQFSRLRELLPRWREVPLYRAVVPDEKIRVSDVDARTRFLRMPFITKQEIRRDFPRNFLRPHQALGSLLEAGSAELDHTSGTSEEQVSVLFPRGWWDEQERSVLRLNRFVAQVLDENLGARRATIAPPACTGQSCPTVWQSRAQRTFRKTRFVNMARIPFVLSDVELARMADETTEWSPRFLDLDPVHGVRFALYCERQGISFSSLRFVLCSYEFVSVVHRRILKRVFKVPLFNLYGSTETGHLLMEDEHGEMRPSYDTAFLEIVEPDDSNIGELAVTTLTNELMPLVHYRIGDLVERQEQPYATTYVVHGRLRDTLRARDGRRITTWQVDQCFAGIAGIAHYQLRQQANGVCCLRFVPDGGGPGVEELKTLTARLEGMLHLPGGVVTETTPLLLPAHSGKFSLTCRV